jgi:hypothetical protein
VKITLLEIYNEQIRDMLRPAGTEAEKMSVKVPAGTALWELGVCVVVLATHLHSTRVKCPSL